MSDINISKFPKLEVESTFFLFSTFPVKADKNFEGISSQKKHLE